MLSTACSKNLLKFRSSLFKGLRIPKAEPWSTSAEVETPLMRSQNAGDGEFSDLLGLKRGRTLVGGSS